MDSSTAHEPTIIADVRVGGAERPKMLSHSDVHPPSAPPRRRHVCQDRRAYICTTLSISVSRTSVTTATVSFIPLSFQHTAVRQQAQSAAINRAVGTSRHRAKSPVLSGEVSRSALACALTS